MENSLNKRSSLLKYIKSLRKGKDAQTADKSKNVDSQLFESCPKCHFVTLQSNLKQNLWVCPQCEHHHYLDPKYRFEMLFDKKYMVINRRVKNLDPLQFPGYKSKKKKSPKNEAVQIAKGTISGHKAVVIAMDKEFMMGSMGSYVGEAIYYAFRFAMKERLPVICFSQSGGARMQEGIISLMQMAKTSEIIGKFHEQGGFFLSVLTNPTTGGVAASFASLGDFMIAEPHALIGFSGPRVIQNTIKEELPNDFQKSEFLLKEGLIDEIVERKNLKAYIVKLLNMHSSK